MSNPAIDAITSAVTGYLTSQGASSNVEAWVKTVTSFVIDACDGKARRDAEAAGQAKADAVKTEGDVAAAFGTKAPMFLAVLLAGLCFMPAHAHAQAADAPLAVATADATLNIPGVSVPLRKGDAAPFDGQENSFPEELRRGKMMAKCQGTLDSEAQNDYIVSRPGFWAVVGVAVAAIGAAIATGVVAKKQADQITALQAQLNAKP